MLETRVPPTSTRTRRPDASPRLAARGSSLARGRSVAGNTALDITAAPRPLSAPRPSRLGRSEMRLMGLATTCTAIVCGLLLLYLAAYARVSQLGYTQAHARSDLRRNQLENENLRAQRDHLQSRRHVIPEAIALGMTPRGATPVTYIAAPSRPIVLDPNRQGGGQMPRQGTDQQDTVQQDTVQQGAGTAANAEQGTSGGTTADNQQSSFDH